MTLRCPDCGGPLVYGGGIVRCPICGYTRRLKGEMNTNRLLLTPAEAGLLLGVSDETVRRMVRKGELHASRHGRNVKIARAELERIAGKALENDRSELQGTLDVHE